MVLLAGPTAADGQVLPGPLERANDFPVRQSAEAVRGQTQRVTVSFNVYFPIDDTRYVPVKEELAKLLSASPRIGAEPGMRVDVVRTVCTPKMLTLTEELKVVGVMGGVVLCEIDVTPDEAVEPGFHDLVLFFDHLSLAFVALGTKTPALKAEAHVRVQVWASAQAKEEAMRRAEEEKRRAAEAQRRQEEIDARKRFERLARIGKWVGVGLAAAVLAVFALWLRRKWIWPDLRLKIPAGGHEQLHHAMSGLSADVHAEPGSILRTAWAQSRLGRRQRVKVEILTTETGLAESPHGKREDKSPVAHDVLVSVGSSVRPGKYLARLAEGAVLVEVLGAVQ